MQAGRAHIYKEIEWTATYVHYALRVATPFSKYSEGISATALL